MQEDASPKGTKAPNEGAVDDKARRRLTASMPAQQGPAEMLVDPCSPIAQESPSQHARLEGQALVVDSAAQTSTDLLPRNPCDNGEINRLRVQLFRKNDTMQRI